MFALWSILFATLCGLPQVATRLTGELGSFASPKTGVKWRYWIQDASVSPDILRSDVAEIAHVGSSGFELLSYQTYGGDVLLDPTDYAFGSDRFVEATAVLVQAAVANHITIDFSMGPNQGAGVPVFPDDVDMEGMLTELAFGSHFLAPGEKFSGSLPSPTVFPDVTNNDTPSANITKLRLVSALVAELVPGADPNFFRVSLVWDTVQDLTSQVDKSFRLSFTAPNNPSVLLAYYSRRNGYPEAHKGLTGSFRDKPGSWGSYVVDHFSPKGAEVTIKFIEQNILAREDIGALAALPGVGGYMWEDSMEFWAQLFWTDAFPERFLERHGYEINKTLPVVSTISTGFAPKPSQSFDFGTTINFSDKFIEDYSDTLTSLYVDYMQTFKDWSHTVGFQFSNQPGYNFHLDVSASAAIPDAPEIETLAILTVDEARQLSGGVHLGNHPIMSSEVGANFGQATSMRMADLLNDAKIQYAGGVNVALLHGFPYSGPYTGCTWPGFTTFDYNFAEMHGPRNPAWNYYKEYLDFLKHTQYALQSGIARVDVAIYRKAYDVTAINAPPFQGDSLFNAGYTYEYVSPENFKLPNVSVSNGRLAPGGPAYKAFILNRQTTITLDAMQRIVQYSKAGLPIVISGPVPNDVPGFDPSGTQQAEVQTLMQQLLQQTNVKVVTDESQVPGALVSLGVLPAVSVSTTVGHYSIRRDVKDDVSFFWLYNPQFGAQAFTLTLRPDFSGTPFLLDGWTGKVSPVALWTKDSQGAISIPDISLASGQNILLAVSSARTFEGVAVPTTHLVALDSPAAAVGDDQGNLEVHSTSDGVFAYTLSTDHTGSVSVSLGGETTRTLDGWQLSIIAWTPPTDLSTENVKSVLVTQPTFNLTQGLVPWNTLKGQANTSGVGTYHTTFQWDDHDGTVGVQLDFGSVFHTIKAWVNGVQIPTADPTAPVVDITQFVVNGSNTLRAEVASTLLNAVNAAPGVETLGNLRIVKGIIPSNQNYGLVDPVRLIPYGRATIHV
ncbi:Secreted protein [Mycena venus]|uniref:Secreted protein n=1 Tax=Mycena venus TaxID=2733690 RepID=A0A8H6XDF2_9AGAR|nr:Secreted protein [Mycena venus]